MQYPDDLLRLAERLEEIAPTVPVRPNQWSRLIDYAAGGIVRGLYLARVWYESGGDEEATEAVIRTWAHEDGRDFLEEVQSLHDLTWALEDSFQILELAEQEEEIEYLEEYLGDLESQLDDEDNGDATSDIEETILAELRVGRRVAIDTYERRRGTQSWDFVDDPNVGVITRITREGTTMRVWVKKEGHPSANVFHHARYDGTHGFRRNVLRDGDFDGSIIEILRFE